MEIIIDGCFLDGHKAALWEFDVQFYYFNSL